MINEYTFLNNNYDTVEQTKECKIDNMMIGVSFFAGAFFAIELILTFQLISEVFVSR